MARVSGSSDAVEDGALHERAIRSYRPSPVVADTERSRPEPTESGLGMAPARDAGLFSDPSQRMRSAAS